MKESIIKNCYDLLENKTPLKRDCGELCGGACCKGDENTGMVLFPGEEKFIDPNMKIAETDGVKYAVCGGTCDRSRRPLSCRIFPLFPYMYREHGRVRVKAVRDIRAAVCPLCEDDIDCDFKKAVRRVGRFLACDSELCEFALSLSAELAELAELKEKLCK